MYRSGYLFSLLGALVVATSCGRVDGGAPPRDKNPISATIVATAPLDFLGDFSLSRAVESPFEPWASADEEIVCADTRECEFVVDEAGRYVVSFESDRALFVPEEIEITEDGQVESVTWEDSLCEWGLAPEGSYRVFDAPCSRDGALLHEELFDARTEIDDGLIVLDVGHSGLSSWLVCGEHAGPAGDTMLLMFISWDSTWMIYVSSPVEDQWLCFE